MRLSRDRIRTASTFLSLTFFWLILTEGDTRQFGLGILFAVLATIASSRLRDPDSGGQLPQPRAIARYAIYFAKQSLLGGFDVARRALRPGRNVKPDYIEYRLRIPPEYEWARLLFAISICLFPGSLSCRLRGDLLLVQFIDQEMVELESLWTLEERVAALGSIRLSGRPG